MEIILTKQCESIQGSLGRGFGYFIVRRGKRFFSQRSRHSVPPDGHWRFILTCAQLAQNKLHITDIRVSRQEVLVALIEKGVHDELWFHHNPKIMCAADVLVLTIELGLL